MKLSIREAAQKMKVETHVLRFWEEELGLLIPRNEMGHRYYGENELLLLKDVQKLKEKGFSLRAVKILLPETELVNQLDDFGLEILKEELEKRFREDEEAENTPKIVVQPIHNIKEEPVVDEGSSDVQQTDSVKRAENQEDSSLDVKPGTAADSSGLLSGEVNVTQFMEIIGRLFDSVLEKNNRLLFQCLEENNKRTLEMQQKLSEGILKEMDYRLRMQEEQQEQYFKNMDEAIKSYQTGGKQVAAALAPGKKRGLFGRRG